MSAGAGASRSPAAGPLWASRLAMAFVLAALVALAAVPFLLQSRLGPLRDQAESADEARTYVTRVQFALARQMSALRGALLTPDPRYLSLHEQALALERSAYPPLDSLTAGLSAPVREALVRMRTLSDEWHAEVDEEAVLRRDTGARGEVLGGDLETYERALDAARALDSVLAAEGRARRAEVRRAEAREASLGGAMALFALLAALAVGWFGRRMRVLAREAAARGAEAERALAEARRVSESRDRMMRGVTHDLKNPLGAADGYATLLEMGLEGELKPGQARMVEGMRRSIAAALALIDDLLDFARAEAGTLDVSREPVDCAAVARDTAERYRGAARAAGLGLELHLPDALPPALADRARVTRIVENVLSNAVKYTPPPGRVTVTVAAGRREGVDGRWIEVRVRDTGPGVPEAERERIFDEFHRVPGATARGHGLGLATSRRAARLLGGDLTVGEAEGGGATFSLWLPVAEENAPG